MQFRPCIDIHNGYVKQIVGASLRDEGDYARENFVSTHDSAYYAKLFREDGIKGAHVIMLNGRDSDYYEATRDAAVSALKAYPGGLQIGGGITAETAYFYMEAKASHVIVTGYAFKNGEICYDNLEKLSASVGKEHVVLDLSCRMRDGKYYVVTDRWQKFTEEVVTPSLFEKLSLYCDEFLVHGVDVEGKKRGINENLVSILAKTNCVITYAGGISSMDDIEKIRKCSDGRLNFTVGSALDIYGGKLEYKRLACLK